MEQIDHTKNITPGVNILVCDAKMDNMEKEIKRIDQVTTKRLDSHSQEIDEITKINLESSILLKQIMERAAEKENENVTPTKPWYESDVGMFVIKSIVVMIFCILGVAIGINVLPLLQ